MPWSCTSACTKRKPRFEHSKPVGACGQTRPPDCRRAVRRRLPRLVRGGGQGHHQRSRVPRPGPRALDRCGTLSHRARSSRIRAVRSCITEASTDQAYVTGAPEGHGLDHEPTRFQHGYWSTRPPSPSAYTQNVQVTVKSTKRIVAFAKVTICIARQRQYS